jgi:DNA polymerase-3 subunit epsilon
MRYIGIAYSEGFKVRIRNKHATGSEDRSHKFSAAYNTGRLWRDRHDEGTQDAKAAKRLRNKFVLKHCTASVVDVGGYDGKASLALIERKVIALALSEETLWNWPFVPQEEPVELVDELIAELRLSAEQREAIERQRRRFLEGAK